MFYSTTLLKKNGKFAIIWKSAILRGKLTRNEIYEVNIREVCEQLLDFVPEKHYTKVRSPQKFSLYLLSELLYGTLEVYRRQVVDLFNDVQRISKSIFSVVIVTQPKIDLSSDGSEHVLDPKRKRSGARTGINGRKRKHYFGSIDLESLTGSNLSPVTLDLDELMTDDQELFRLAEQADHIFTARPEDITMIEEELGAIAHITPMVDDFGDLAKTDEQRDRDLMESIRVEPHQNGLASQDKVVDFEDFMKQVEAQGLLDRSREKDIVGLEIEKAEKEIPIYKTTEQVADEAMVEQLPIFELEELPVVEERAAISHGVQKRRRMSRLVIDSVTSIPTEILRDVIRSGSELVVEPGERRISPHLHYPNAEQLFAPGPPRHYPYLCNDLKQLYTELVVPRQPIQSNVQNIWAGPGVFEQVSSEQSSIGELTNSKLEREEQPPIAGEMLLGDLMQPELAVIQEQPEPAPIRLSEIEMEGLIGRPSEEIVEQVRKDGSMDSVDIRSTRRGTILVDRGDLSGIEEKTEPSVTDKVAGEGEKRVEIQETVAAFGRRYSAIAKPSVYEMKRNQFLNEIGQCMSHARENHVTFGQLTEGATRSEAAKKFYLILALKGRGKIHVEQDQDLNFAPICIQLAQT